MPCTTSAGQGTRWRSTSLPSSLMCPAMSLQRPAGKQPVWRLPLLSTQTPAGEGTWWTKGSCLWAHTAAAGHVSLGHRHWLSLSSLHHKPPRDASSRLTPDCAHTEGWAGTAHRQAARRPGTITDPQAPCCRSGAHCCNACTVPCGKSLRLADNNQAYSKCTLEAAAMGFQSGQPQSNSLVHRTF